MRLRQFRLDQPVNITVADQMLVSCGNFLFGVLLARSIGITEFGRFSLSWLAIDLLVSVQFVLILQPMLNIGPKQSARHAARYFGAVTVQEVTIALGSGLAVWFVVLAAHLGFGWSALGALGLPLSLGVMAAQSHDFVRRYFFTRGRCAAALLVDTVRYALQLGGVVLAGRLTWGGSAATGLWIVAIGCASGTVAGAVMLGPLAWDRRVFRYVLVRHWRFSRWLLPSTLMNVAIGQVFPLAAGSLLGVATVGLMNIGKTALGFINVLLLALNNFAPVQASRTLHLAGRAALRRYIRRLGLATILVALSIIAAVVAFPDYLIHLVYGQAFGGAVAVVRWYCMAYLFYTMSAVLIVWAAAGERTKPIFYSSAAAAVVALLGAFPLARLAGLTGIMIIMVATELVRLLTLAILLLRDEPGAARLERRKPTALWSAEPVRSEIPEV